MRPSEWTGSGYGFDRLPGVVVLELGGAQVSERRVKPSHVVGDVDESGKIGGDLLQVGSPKTESTHLLELPSTAVGTSATPSEASKSVQLPPSAGTGATLGKKKRTCDACGQLAAVPEPGPDPALQPAPDPAPPPQPQRFKPPLAVSGERLYACQTLDGKGCGQAVATLFCQQKGFAKADGFDTSRQSLSAETLSGEKCTKKKCRVFDLIACTP